MIEVRLKISNWLSSRTTDERCLELPTIQVKQDLQLNRIRRNGTEGQKVNPKIFHVLFVAF